MNHGIPYESIKSGRSNICSIFRMKTVSNYNRAQIIEKSIILVSRDYMYNTRKLKSKNTTLAQYSHFWASKDELSESCFVCALPGVEDPRVLFYSLSCTRNFPFCS
jgi:hypothetical protein